MENLKYTIKAASKFAGVSEFVIRAWEKRYKILEPDRTETNRRLYSHEDVKKLKLLADAVKNGHSIGTIANLKNEDLIKLSSSESLVTFNDTANSTDEEKILERMLVYVKNLDDGGLRNELLRASSFFSNHMLIKNLIIPFLYKIGDLWEDGTFRVVNEHFASVVISSFLMDIRESYKVPPNAPVILFCTPSGQMHEFGSLITATIAASKGFRVVYLGPNLPVSEIINAAVNLKVKAVSLSISYPTNDKYLYDDLKIFALFNRGFKIIVGGNAAYSYKDVLTEVGAAIMNDVDDFRLYLDKLL